MRPSSGSVCVPPFGAVCRLLCGLLAVHAAGAWPALQAAADPAHPLDALTPAEHWVVHDVLQSSGRLGEQAFYAAVALREPPKAEVLAWKPGAPFRREALAVLRDKGRTYEAVVDVAARKLSSWKEVGGQPTIVPSEERVVDDLLKKNPEVIAALKRRGITDLSTVGCWGAPAGYFGKPEDSGRVMKSGCSEGHGTFMGGGSPIEGLIAVVDLDQGKVLRVTDSGPVPLAGGRTDYDDAVAGPRRDLPGPMRVDQPQGPGFTLTGRQVSWQKWSFRFRIDPRRAAVVSDVRYEDGGRLRSVLYQGSLSEIFVPYMDPGEGWYYLTYVDLGDYAGLELVSSLEPGLDCPAHAFMFDMVVADEHGIPRPRPRAACLFERAAGDIAWRHDSQERGVVESRARRDLVLRTILVAGNYDYVTDWVFRQDGVIEVETGATGVVAFKSAARRSFMADEQGHRLAEGRDDPYGRYIAEHAVAVNHDHYFSYRLDLDVDGVVNSMVIDTLKTQRLEEPNPRRSIWTVESSTARVEHDARLHMSMEKPALWRFVNPKVRGRLGYPVSYEIRAGHNAMSLLLPEDFVQRRAGFIEHNLWVTPYRPEELYAAGDYPVQSRGGEGLPAWTAADRSIENTDIVAWYTVGFHHVVRAEDWPVTPAMKHGFELRPFDFFSGNPAMDLPERP